MFPTDDVFESEFTFENAAVPIPEEPPFNILLLGDWSGDSFQKSLDERRPINIDRDNFDDVLREFNLALEINLQDDEENVLQLRFAEFDDFHPDNLFRNVSLFSDLRDVRNRLSNSETFDDAAFEVRSWFANADDNSINDVAVQSEIDDVPPIESGNLLDRILTPSTNPNTARKVQHADESDLGRFVSQIVSPYLIKIDENEQSKLIAAVDEIISELMRAILHHPKFQALESAWRGLYFLVRRIETDVDLKIFVLNVTKDELANNFKSANSLTDSFLYSWLISESVETIDSESFAIIGGNYSFGLNVDDIALLMRIAKLAEAANVPFVSYIRPEIFGFKDFSVEIEASQIRVLETANDVKLWTVLRSSAESDYLALSPMRILARVPFGEATNSTETFSFEEFTEFNGTGNYLWMNPCFAVILLLAQRYRQYSWQMGQYLHGDINNLPMYIYQRDGEKRTKPCAEIVLTESLLENLLGQGLMPLISFRNSDKVRLLRMQPVSSSSTNLNGKWNV